MTEQVKFKIGNEELILETGKMAKQANGSVLARYAGVAVLATVCCSSSEVEGLDYVPLSVEYNEKYYAAGKIPGGFLKREARPKDKEILVSRLIDRPMRPLFDKKFGREIQIVPTVVSADQIHTPDVIAMVAASAAVTISDIPFAGPVAAVRVAYVGGEYLVNPNFEQIEKAELDIVIAGTVDGITMVEGGSKEVSEEMMLTAIEKGFETIKLLCAVQLELKAKIGKEKIAIQAASAPIIDEAGIKNAARAEMEVACFIKGKHNRSAAIKALFDKYKSQFLTDPTEEQAKAYASLMDHLEQDVVRKSILDNKVRTDGRGPEDIRNISCEVSVLPRTHGAALFTRGETQALAVTTLGTVFDEQIMDDIDGDKRQNFMLHYNFPPFSVGETGRLSTGRREIGHGHLAQRAIEGILPTKSAFPYTVRIVSEVLESNGSSSMATVCGGCLSLLDAGVPIKDVVAGIAMGLITEGDKFVVLSDILGEEDHLGDMDFKVAGTEKGITAFQMDIKISSVSPEIMTAALDQAKRGRMKIIGIMKETLSGPRTEISSLAPKILNMKVDPDKIGLIIGSGGKNVKAISEKYGVNINIENDGQITIYGRDSSKVYEAENVIKSFSEEPEIGKEYVGVVKRITDFGAFIEIMPGKEGLCHISKMSKRRLTKVSEVMNLGDELPVKIIEVDRMGRINIGLVNLFE